MMYVQLFIGFVFLIGGAELMVRGAVSLASRLGISPLVVGMTIVAIGTSAPEFVVSVNAVFNGATGLAVGNVIGSNIANVLLVLGISCMLTPMLKKPAVLGRDVLFLGFGSLIFLALCLSGELGKTAGILLLIGFFSFIGLSYIRKSEDEGLAVEYVNELEELQGWPESFLSVAFAIIFGLFGLALGAELLVRGGADIARSLGVSEEVIGLTVFAFGTSLPELAASVIAAFKGHLEIGVGNIVGSNLFNILGVAGVAALVAPLPLSQQVLSFDIWVMLASSFLLIFVLMNGMRMGRLSGTVFALAYVGYIWSQSVGVGQIMG